MRKSLLAALACLSLASPAFATDWYVLDYHRGECTRGGDMGNPHVASPSAYEDALRQLGEFREKQIVRGDDGKIIGVVIGDTSGMAMSYFATVVACEQTKQRAINNGLIGKPGELR
jgi:hypothetical protein